MYIPNSRAAIFEVKTDRTKRRNRQPTITVGDFNTPLSTTDRTRQKIRNDVGSEQHNQQTRSNKHLQITPLLTAEYTVYSNAHRTYTNIEYILGCKTNLDKFKINEI